jgi:23S rRNA pseudouridine1911/1915/1917 synthase
MNKEKLEILYEDNHVIVVYKPANILSQGDATGDKDMLTLVKEYIKEKYHKPGNVYVGLVHRLDRPVQGVMVFAKSSKAASRLTKQIQNHEFRKQYLAIINGKLKEKNGKFSDYIEKQEDGNSVITDSKHGKEAILKYEVLKEINNLSLVRIELITGRHHQIRVQFASRGYPLVGDQRYGKIDKKQICLCSYSLSFIHPITKERLTFERYPEKNDDWDLFL